MSVETTNQSQAPKKQQKKSEAVLREATTKDLRAMTGLLMRQVEYEASVGNCPLIEDPQERRYGIMELLAEALVDPEQYILLVDKSGRVMGLFIVYITYRPAIFKRNKIINLWSAYTNKSTIYIKRVEAKLIAWGKERGCNGFQAYTFSKNERGQRLSEALKFEDFYRVYEKDI